MSNWRHDNQVFVHLVGLYSSYFNWFQIMKHFFLTCCDLFLSHEYIFQGEGGCGIFGLLPEMSSPLPRHQAEGLISVRFTKTGHRDQPSSVPHLLHKVLSCCRKHDCSSPQLEHFVSLYVHSQWSEFDLVLAVWKHR